MKIRVGVIFGGESVEHEVSIISAIQAMNKMDEEKYEITKEWTKVISTADVKNTDEYEIGFMSFAEENGDVIVDDMYCGKLLISDIETVIDEAVVIPENGSK